MRLDGAEGQFALDMQGLQRLQQGAREQTPEATRAAAQQFEALFLHQMIKSMRATVPSSGLTDSRHTEFYQSLLDHQWAQTMAERGVGLADLLVEQFESGRYGGASAGGVGAGAAASAAGPASDAANALGDVGGKTAPAPDSVDLAELIVGIPRGVPRLVETPRSSPSELEAAAAAANDAEHDAAPASFLDAWGGRSTGSLLGENEGRATGGGLRAGWNDAMGHVTEGWGPSAGGLLGAWGNAPGGQPPQSVAMGAAREDTLPHVHAFREQLAAPAQAASRKSGVPAELILAQAALETGWGRHQIITAEGRNSHNLFGIKAGSRWTGPTTEIVTHEYYDGERTRISDRFRVYASFEAAFTDYARLISANPRYAGVSAAQSPAQAARELQAGGYATDPAYADKLITIMNNLGPLMAKAGNTPLFQRN